MKFSTAIEFIKNGYFVADTAMTKIGSAIGLVDVDDIDDPILVIKDAYGMETFTLEPSIVFDNENEWSVALETKENGFYDYISIDDSKVTNEIENLGQKIMEKNTNSCNNKTSDSSEDKLKQLQEDFLSKATQLIYESDITKKISLYAELADITAAIQKFEREVK